VNIVFASHTAMGGPFVVGSHHLARQFAAMGHSVLHLSTPITPFHLMSRHEAAIQTRFANWRQDGISRDKGLLEYVPLALVPWQASRYLLGRANPLLWCMPTLARVMRRIGFSIVDLLLVDQPKMVGIEDIVSPRKLIYRATDLYHEFTGDERVATAEVILARKAHLLVGTSQPVVDHLQALRTQKRALLLENGVDVEHLATARPLPVEYQNIRTPRAVYIGALDERLDVSIIRDLCLAIPQLSVIAIGPVPASLPAALKGISNLVLLGPRSYDLIPAFLQHADIGLLPLTSHPANAGRSPMKLYEYGAAGLYVVATATPELVRRSLPFVCLARDGGEFIAGVQAVLDKPALLEDKRRAAREISAGMDWKGIAARLLNEIGEA
jgi:glycosyltransferase involved in cell wall biosynthesis